MDRMLKTIILFYISNSLIVAQAFFINGRDIRRFFGIAPSFYDIYKKEASQNHPHDENDEMRSQYPNQYPNQYQKYENNINEKLPSTYYKIRPSQNIFKYVREYSTKQENTIPYTHNEDKNYDMPHTHYIERTKNTPNGHNPKIYLQLPSTLSKFQVQATKNNREANEELDTTDIDDKKKNLISGVLVALPNFNIKELPSERNYLKSENNDKYFIKALFSNTPPAENNEPDNIFFR